MKPISEKFSCLSPKKAGKIPPYKKISLSCEEKCANQNLACVQANKFFNNFS